MSRAGPFGEETALQPTVHESLLHLVVHLGIYEVQEGEQGAESIPETGIGKIIPVLHSSVMEVVVDYFPFGSHLGNVMRKYHRAVQAAVERTHIIYASAFGNNSSQDFVPSGASLLLHGIERSALRFRFRVESGLFGTDEGSGHFQVHDIPATGGKAHHCHHVVAFGTFLPFCEFSILYGGDILEGTVRCEDEPFAEVFGDSAYVTGGVAFDSVTLYLYSGASVICIDYEI